MTMNALNLNDKSCLLAKAALFFFAELCYNVLYE